MEKNVFETIFSPSNVQRKALDCLLDCKASSWLKSLPNKRKQEDQQSVTPVGQVSLNNPPFLSKKGLELLKHNKIIDTVDDLSTLLWSKQKKEPITCFVDIPPSLVADQMIWGKGSFKKTHRLISVSLRLKKSHIFLDPLRQLWLVRNAAKRCATVQHANHDTLGLTFCHIS